MKYERITVDATQMDGMPCIRGLRIPVATVIGMLADNMSEAEVLEALPDLEQQDIHEARKFAGETRRPSPFS